MTKSPNNLPDKGNGNGNGARKDDFRALRVDTLIYQANDLTELRKLAETNPELAKQVVTTKDHMHRREHWSFVLGMSLTAILALSLVAGVAWIVVNLGWVQSLIFVACMIAAGHFLRVAMTGEWSETSWIGKIFSLRKDKDDAKEE